MEKIDGSVAGKSDGYNNPFVARDGQRAPHRAHATLVLSDREQKQFTGVCLEHIWAAIGMHVLYSASGSESDACSAAISVRDLVDIAPAYRDCWEQVRPIVQSQGFSDFIAIVEHETRTCAPRPPRGSGPVKSCDAAPERDLSSEPAESVSASAANRDGELTVERVLSGGRPAAHELSRGAAPVMGDEPCESMPRRRHGRPGDQNSRLPTASLRVLAGRFAGRELALNDVVTQLGHRDGHLVAITRQHDGYSVVCLESGDPGNAPLINGAAIGTRARVLRDNDVLQIAGIKAQFSLY